MGGLGRGSFKSVVCAIRRRAVETDQTCEVGGSDTGSAPELARRTSFDQRHVAMAEIEKARPGGIV